MKNSNISSFRSNLFCGHDECPDGNTVVYPYKTTIVCSQSLVHSWFGSVGRLIVSGLTVLQYNLFGNGWIGWNKWGSLYSRRSFSVLLRWVNAIKVWANAIKVWAYAIKVWAYAIKIQDQHEKIRKHCLRKLIIQNNSN